MNKSIVIAFVLTLTVTTTVTAQTPRVSIAAGAAVQPTTSSFTDISTFPYVAETSRFEGDYDIGAGVAFDVGATVRVWRALGAGFAVTGLTRQSSAETSGSFPHPFFFNASRTGTWSQGSLDRTERGLHVSAVWDLWRDRRFTASVFGGPSLFNFKQTVIDRVDSIESYPYDTIDARLIIGTMKGSAIGFHAGADLGWFFSRYVGVGGVVRFTKGTKNDARIGSGEPFDLALGGAQGGAGLRLRF